MKTVMHAIVLIAALATVGCNTVKGVGQDLQKAGSTIEDAAKKKQ